MLNGGALRGSRQRVRDGFRQSYPQRRPFSRAVPGPRSRRRGGEVEEGDDLGVPQPDEQRLAAATVDDAARVVDGEAVAVLVLDEIAGRHEDAFAGAPAAEIDLDARRLGA